MKHTEDICSARQAIAFIPIIRKHGGTCIAGMMKPFPLYSSEFNAQDMNDHCSAAAFSKLAMLSLASFIGSNFCTGKSFTNGGSKPAVNIPLLCLKHGRCTSVPDCFKQPQLHI